MSVPFFSTALLQQPGIRHAFFGRKGGASKGIYASLNAGPGSKDDPAAVEQNRAAIAKEIGVAPDHLLSVHQVHSPRVVRVNGPWTEERPQVDAMVTTARGVALCILAADCAPVLFADRSAGVIGAAHAGWQGALGGVIESTLDEMERAGANRARISATVGPCIAQTSYEVGPEYQARFVDADSNNARFFRPGAGDRLHFDLKGFCRSRLARAGIEHIDVMPHDTCALADNFFSNRRAVKTAEGDYGRNASVIVLT